MTSGAPLPQPTASGTLAKTPFPHLLLYLMEKQLTGSVEVMAPDGERATILVLEGFPSKVRTSEPTSYLSNVLLETGIVTSEQLEASMQYFRPGQGQLHGEVLVSLGILDMPRLLEGLRRQVVHKLEYLFNWPADSQYAYYDAFDALAGYGADDLITVDPLPLVWGAIKQAPSWEHAHAALSRVGGAPLRVAANAQVERLGLTPDERQFVELLRPRPRRIYEMTAAGTIGPSVKQLLIYCMLIAKQLEIIAEEPSIAPPPMAPRRSAPVPAGVPAAGPPGGPPSNATVARVQLQPRQIPRPGAVAVDEPAPASVVRRDSRASSPVLTPAPPAVGSAPLDDIASAIAEATRGLDSGAPPPPLPGTVLPGLQTTPSVAPPSAQMQVPARPSGGMSAAVPGPPPSRPSGSMPVDEGPPSSQRNPANLASELAAQRHRILQRAEEITRLDYFQMLGIPREASTDDVQKAYFLLAKVWHPDRLPPAIRDVREQCSKVFAHLSEAHQTLTDQERRSHYMTLIKDGGATPDDQAQIAGILEAATNFQKAEVCLRRNDLVQAEQLARAAHDADPQQADYLALVAWLESMKPENVGTDATERRIAMLFQALKLNAKCERAYFYRGMLFKRLGNEKAAYKDFKDAVELNPRNIDATREMRLYAMRKKNVSSPPGPATPSTRPGGRQPPPEPSGGGLFGKLFKK
jgi:tetratricopeptide (TPR) repeat protein